MHNNLKLSVRALQLAAAVWAGCSTAVLAQTTATWTGAGGNNDWNNGLNWDQGAPPADVTTNAVIGAGSTVNYDAPMAAASFGSLTLNGVLSVNASGFVSGGGAALVSGSSARLYVTGLGTVSITNGGLACNTGASGSVATGGSVSLQGTLYLGGSGSGNTGFMTNNGGMLTAPSTSINPNNISSSCLLVINGGTNSLGSVRVRRAGPSSLPSVGSDGLTISNGIVSMTSLLINDGNSYGSMLVAGGATTNTGNFMVGQQTGGNNRPTRYLQTGGLVVSTISDGIRLGVTNGNQTVWFSLMGGTNVAERVLIGDGTNGAPSITVRFTNQASLFLGRGGFAINNPGSYTIALNNGGTTGANADWTTGLPLLLNSGTHTFDAADIGGTAHNITFVGTLSGGGGLAKAGGGTLLLAGTNVYSGPTTVSAGTLALAATGSISNTTQIAIGSGAVLDVSAVNGAAVLGSQTLAGNGAVAGALTALPGSTLRPGGLLAAGTLTFGAGLTEVGGVNNGLDLSDDPTGTVHPNDLLSVTGDLNISGTNELAITAINGPLALGSAYKVIQYGGSFHGGLTNFSVTGVDGVLSNDVSGKAIYLVIRSVTRAPTDVVWLGNPAANNWDMQSTSNWLNGASRDIFVPGDNARFDDTGATNPLVNIIGSVDPGSVIVDTASNYTYTGSGSIDGSGGLLKTNRGTLTILTTNGYPGPTLIGEGILEAIRLANGGAASSIGASANDATNLQFFGTTLRYLGPTSDTDRGALLNGNGATIDVANAGAALTLNGTVGGPGALVKAGPGTLVLANANTPASGVVVEGGTLQANSVAALGTAGVTNLGAILRLATAGTVTVPNVLDFDGICTIDLANTAGDTHLDGAWSGNATVNIVGQQNASRTFTVGGNGSSNDTAGHGNLVEFAGTINMGTNTGSLRFNDGGGNYNTGSTNVTIDLGTGSATFLVRNGGLTIDVGALAGGPNTRVTGRGSGSSGTVTYSVGGNNTAALFAGTIADSTSGNMTAITKVGTGTWTLAGTNTYTGSTIVSNGVLALSGYGSIATSPAIDLVPGAVLGVTGRDDGTLLLASDQTLLDEGTVRGNLTVASNAVVAPGATVGVIGKLTVTGAMSVQPNAIIAMDVDSFDGTNDIIDGLSSVTYGGILALGISSIDLNSSFKLFNATSYRGMFDTIFPATPGYGWMWDTSRLTVDGTLKVKPLVVTHPQITLVTTNGQTLTVSGTGGPAYFNYTVFSSPDVTLPLLAWTVVGTANFKGDGSFALSVPMDPNQAQQFYRIVFTAPQ